MGVNMILYHESAALLIDDVVQDIHEERKAAAQ